MSAVKKLIGQGVALKTLKSFELFKGLAPQLIKEISEKASIIELAKDRVLFKEGDSDSHTYFLVKGEMNFSSSKIDRDIKAGTDKATKALYNSKPRKVTATAKSKVSILSIESSMLEFLLDTDSETIYEVNELNTENDQDWMSRFLHSMTEMNIPAKNMQALMMRMQEINVKAGDTVINQFDDDDYYYIVKEGRCTVSRKASAEGSDIKLAELDEGDCFGEEAIISNTKRSATVRMLDNGSLMRLARQDFLELLAQPSITSVAYNEACKLAKEGAIFLDVRQVAEHTRDGIKAGLNIPLNVLRLRLFELNKKNKYIVYCDNQNKSSAAVFLMLRQGYDCVVLKDGLSQVPRTERIQFYPDQPASEVVARNKVKQAPKPPETSNIFSLPGVSPHAEPQQEPAATSEQNSGKLKKKQQFAVNQSDEHEDKDQSLRALAEEREKVKIANEQKELAQAEALKVKQEYEARLQQELARRDQELLELKNISEQRVREAQERSSEELKQMQSSAEKLQEKYLNEASELQGKEDELRKIASELELAREESRKFRTEYEILSEKVEVESSRASSLDEAYKQALAENEKLKVDVHKIQVEAEQTLNMQVEENNRKLQKELNEINNRMKDEKNRASAAEEALRRAQQREAELRAEAEAARLAAEKDKQRLARIQEDKLRELEDEILRAEDAERAQKQAEALAEKLKAEAEEAKRQAEENYRIANQARDKAESGTSQIRAEIEAAKRSAEEAMKKSERAEAERRKIEQEIKKQSDVLAAVKKAEEEKQKAVLSDQARKKAEQEVDKLKAKLIAQKKAALARRKAETAAATEQKQQYDPYAIEQYVAKDLDVDAPNLLDKGEDAKVGTVRKSGWISDALLWETTLGLREDEESEGYLGNESMPEDSRQKTASPAVKKAAVDPKPKKKERRNPNVSSFSAKDPVSDRPSSRQQSGFKQVPEEKEGSSIKMFVIGAVVVLLLLVGGGGYYLSVNEDAKLPASISTIIDKAKNVEKAISGTAGEKVTAEPVEKKAPGAAKLTPADIKVMKERAELRARDSASAQFKAQKKQSSVITAPAQALQNTVDESVTDVVVEAPTSEVIEVPSAEPSAENVVPQPAAEPQSGLSGEDVAAESAEAAPVVTDTSSEPAETVE